MQLIADLDVRYISIHAPAWGATVYGYGPGHEEMISIHAPAWGATIANLTAQLVMGISIHAPAWGATGRDR